MEEEVTHGICEDCLYNEMGMSTSPERREQIARGREESGLTVVCAWCTRVLYSPNRRNPEEMDQCINCNRLFPADDAFE